MKAIAQTFLVGMGVLGLLLAVPAAFHTWFQHRSSGANFTADQIGRLWSPFICFTSIAIGVVWQKRTKRSESRRRGVLTEDGTCGDGGGGGDGGSD